MENEYTTRYVRTYNKVQSLQIEVQNFKEDEKSNLQIKVQFLHVQHFKVENLNVYIKELNWGGKRIIKVCNLRCDLGLWV
jgi:hypothetical protein